MTVLHFSSHLNSVPQWRQKISVIFSISESNPATQPAEENKPRDVSRRVFCKNVPAFVLVYGVVKRHDPQLLAGGKRREATCCCVGFILLTWLSSHALIVDMIWKVLYSSVLRWWWVCTEVWYHVLKHFTHPPASAGKSFARALLLTELMWSDGTLAPLEDLYFSVYQWHPSLFNFILGLATWSYLPPPPKIYFLFESLANCVLSRGSLASPADWMSSLTLWEHRANEGVFRVIL